MVNGASTPTGSTSSFIGWVGSLLALAARVSAMVRVRTCKWRNWVARWRRAAQFQVMSVFSSVTVSAPAFSPVRSAFSAWFSGLRPVSFRRYTNLSICPPRRKLPLTPSTCKLLPAGMWRCTRRSRVLSDSSVADQNHNPPKASANTINNPSAAHRP